MANYTVHNAMALYWVDNENLFQGKTKAERVVDEIFSNTFETVIEKTIKELNSNFKMFLEITATQG